MPAGESKLDDKKANHPRKPEVVLLPNHLYFVTLTVVVGLVSKNNERAPNKEEFLEIVYRYPSD